MYDIHKPQQEHVTMYFFYRYKTRTPKMYNVTAYGVMFHENASTELCSQESIYLGFKLVAIYI